jgi:hypothetical protein
VPCPAPCFSRFALHAKVVPLRLAGNKLRYCLFDLAIESAAAQKASEIGAGVAGKAGPEHSGGTKPQTVAPVAEHVAEGADKADKAGKAL